MSITLNEYVKKNILDNEEWQRMRAAWNKKRPPNRFPLYTPDMYLGAEGYLESVKKLMEEEGIEY